MKYETPDTLTMVALFHHTFDHLVQHTPDIPDAETKQLRINLIREEFEELIMAVKENDMVQIADALADLQYVLSGTILSFGLGSAFNDIFNEVQRSNMSKACDSEHEAYLTVEAYNKKHEDDGETAYYKEMAGKFCVRRKSDDKTIKGINYSPANFELVLFTHSLKQSQVWLEYVDEVLLRAFIVHGHMKMGKVVLMDESGWMKPCDTLFLQRNCELLEDVERMAEPEEKARVIALQRQYMKRMNEVSPTETGSTEN